MPEDLESLVLSGKLFSGASRSPSPERSPSPANTDWPELKDDGGSDYDSDKERSKEIDRILSQQQAGSSVGVGVTGRTGVKGVIRDKREAELNAREQKQREVDDLNKKMERAALSARTYREEEEERMWERQMLEGGERNGALDFFGAGRKGSGRFGHLREVGVNGFLPAIEEEDRNVWVLVHLYAPSLDRCYALDDTLAHLARRHPKTKFLRCRAGALGFASSSSSSSRPAARSSTARKVPGGLSTIHDDEDDPYGEPEDGAEEEDQEDDDGDNVDLDMLPTMLVYRGGDLVFNWVRVDLEAGRGGIEELLMKHRVITALTSGNGNCGLPSDDEDDFLSDQDL
ncbi:thioredoxin-like protein [Neolentinus lepideus HHB14362 ss-1]|uniref:Thioredoxin-like protein n=1 Tax=Neolentinus lepideus HHB14362 ss-1 TaxID=1314782 RepID=A0A165VF70_9AGAM|nr:thioredoxin-like protein [Neolentinus lepideus HHB14362 ss-1]